VATSSKKTIKKKVFGKDIVWPKMILSAQN